MKKTKLSVLILALIMVLSMFAGCNTTKNEELDATEAPAPAVTDENTEPVAEPLEEYEIEAYFPGDTPLDFDLVMAEVEKQSADLNVKLKFQFVPWSDYGNKVMTKISAGEDFDLHLNAPWLHMQQLIASEAIMPWDDLLAEHGTNVLKQFATPIQYNKFDDKIYGIPLTDRLGAYNLVNVYRGDLREAVGMDVIKTDKEMEEYYYKVKEQFPDIIPFTWNGSNYAQFVGVWDDGRPHQVFQFGQNNCFVQVEYELDGTVDVDKIQPIYEWQPFIDAAKRSQQWYADGIIDPDVLAQTDMKGMMNAGRTAQGSDEYFNEPLLQESAPGAWTEYSMPYIDTEYKQITDFKAWNFLCLNAKAENPVRVTQWYNWIFEDQANYDLLQLGIEGIHWKLLNDGRYDYPEGVSLDSTYNFPGYVLMWNANFLRFNVNWPDTYPARHEVESDADNFIKGQLAGFTVDLTTVEDEIAKCSAVWAETIFVLSAGVVEDVDASLADAKKSLEAAGYLKVVEECKRQISEFIASQN